MRRSKVPRNVSAAPKSRSNVETFDLEAAYREHGQAVYNVARIIGGRDQSAVITQEIFLELWSHPQGFDPTRRSLRASLLSKAYERARNVQAMPSEREKPEAVVGDPPDQEALTSAILALATLPSQQRDAVTVVVFGQCTYKEVADILDLPEAAVLESVSGGFVKMRDFLDCHDVDDAAQDTASGLPTVVAQSSGRSEITPPSRR